MGSLIEHLKNWKKCQHTYIEMLVYVLMYLESLATDSIILY